MSSSQQVDTERRFEQYQADIKRQLKLKNELDKDDLYLAFKQKSQATTNCQ